jgi:hypothetical protein
VRSVVRLSILLALGVAVHAAGLEVAFDGNGVQQIKYNGVVLEDLAQNPADAFHIWHMKSTDLEGNTIGAGQYGWGEANNGRRWNAATHTWTYSFVWGAISVRFTQSGDTLNMHVTERNYADSGIVFDGATIYPFVLHFPQLPNGFGDSSYPQLAYNTNAPSVTLADFGAGVVAAVFADPARPLYTGFAPAGGGNNYYPVVSSTSPDSLAPFEPHFDRPLEPGQSDQFTISLRFGPSGAATSTLASDAYRNWARAWPHTLHWTDRRLLGTVYLASSPQGDPSWPGGYPNNPRRFYNDPSLDIVTPAGLAAFQSRILQQAWSNVQNLQQLNAQGAITWDIEGEQFPQPTSYACQPDEIAQLAPEMESVISDTASPYYGQKLDDAYFKIMRDAGFRVGVCVRPQHFTVHGDRSAEQALLPDSQTAEELIRKIRYAHDRWGATLFYVDSNVDRNGATLDATIFAQVAAAFPDSLVMPEHSTPKYYAYTAPFLSFLFHGDLGTPSDVYNYYPQAFSVNLVNDVDAGRLNESKPPLTHSMHRGDILMVHGDYWQDNNPTVVQMYQAAH